ncbi:LysR family transcriptional regulator [Streptomyces sp. A7024]|uniref:LysR family transcriptional regulator n=1 Tax=Streptomyces coryli TaxID=1128680 RepID=A0A6G4TWP3_9ACTN|nr:LysR family transcriptional regulator [Streptomyces coryli]NGN63940.1 LysR family transcriptional regulator [Streptomyces coryli]
MIDLRRLRVLRAVAYYGTVTAAAESLRLTPSAASQQIKQLGQDLGVPLLEPVGRRVRLTAAARSLLTHADAIEARWQRAHAELLGMDGEPAGLLRMAGFPTALCRLLAPVAGELSAHYPRLDIRLREAEPRDAFDLLFDDETDIAVVEALPDGPATGDQRFDQRLLLDDPFDLLVPADHGLAGLPEVDLVAVAAEKWIIGVPGSSSRQHVLAACSAAGFSPNVTHEACDWSAVTTLVSYGLGVALVPRLAQLPPQRDMDRIPVSGTPAPSRRFLTCTRRGAAAGPAVAEALRALHAREDLAAVMEPVGP